MLVEKGIFLTSLVSRYFYHISITQVGDIIRPLKLTFQYMSNEKNLGCLGCIGDYTTQYLGILISQDKDPYKPTRIQWKVGRFFS